MTEEILGRVFAPFEQAEVSTARRYGGTGLGLAISKHLVEAMKGRIWAESEPNAGMTIHLSIRLQPAVEDLAAEESLEAYVMGPLLLLLAEDNVVNQRVARRILENAGHEVHTVVDGRAAVEAHATGEYDPILMDVEMPHMDCLEATRTMRANEAAAGGGRRTPIVALTAHALEEAVEACRAAGLDGHVFKPIERVRLFAALQRVTLLLRPRGESAA